jgi:mRNA deadenylase 3'-5' endonuclease subunit Ccr4
MGGAVSSSVKKGKGSSETHNETQASVQLSNEGKDLFAYANGESQSSPRKCPLDGDFSVMSWNVLAECFFVADTLSQCNGHCSDEIKSWPTREALLMEEIVRCNPDVLCLQEWDINAFDTDFRLHLSKEGYDGVIQKGHTLPTMKHSPIAHTATFFKRDKFRLAGTFDRSRTMAVVLGGGRERWS